jgi:hypothetical protein
MSARDGSVGKTMGWMIAFILIGAPFVYLIWDFVNHLLSGRFELATFGLALVGAGGLTVVLRFVARRAASWEEAQ